MFHGAHQRQRETAHWYDKPRQMIDYNPQTTQRIKLPKIDDPIARIKSQSKVQKDPAKRALRYVMMKYSNTSKILYSIGGNINLRPFSFKAVLCDVHWLI